MNFLAIPLMTVVQVAGLLAVGLSLFADGAARVCGYVAHLAASGIIETARLIDLAPWVSWRVAALGLVLSAAYCGGWIILITESPRRSVRTGAGIAIVATACLMIGGPFSLPGDIGSAVEFGLVDAIPSAPVRIVKVPQHREPHVELGSVRRGTPARGGGGERWAGQLVWSPRSRGCRSLCEWWRHSLAHRPHGRGLGVHGRIDCGRRDPGRE